MKINISISLATPIQKRFFLAGIVLLLVLINLNEVLAQEKVKENEIEVSGIVSERSGLSLPGADVIIKGSIRSTKTDLDGKFTITVKQRDTIILSFPGHKSSFFIVDNRKDSNFQNKIHILEVEMIVCKRPNFLKRLFYSIGNLFRKEKPLNN